MMFVRAAREKKRENAVKALVGPISVLLVAACQSGAAPDDNAAGDGTAPEGAFRVADAVGVWEPYSKGAVGIGAVTVSPESLNFVEAGVASIVDKGGYVTLDWENTPSPAVSFCGGEPPRTAQLQVLQRETSTVLEIAFFASAGKPSDDRDNDLDLCAIQYWAPFP